MTAELIRSAIGASLAGAGLLVEDVGVTRAGRRQVVRVAVDRDLAALDLPDDTTPVPPLSLDEVADATRLVSDALDAADVLGDAAYVLEVSSPGVDRPLTQRRHLRRNVGRIVVLTPAEGDAVSGRIVAVGADDLVLDTEGGPVRIPVASVRRARVQVEFGRVDGFDEQADPVAEGDAR